MSWALPKVVAATCRRDVRTIYRWVAEGRIRFVRLAGGNGLLVQTDERGFPVPTEPADIG